MALEDLVGERAFSYSNITRVCNEVMQDNQYLHITDIVTGCKILAATFIIVNVIVRYLGNRKAEDDIEKAKRPITLAFLGQQVGLILLVFNFSTITMYLDTILSAFCQTIEQSVDDNSGSMYNVVNTALLANITEAELEAGDTSVLYEIWVILENLLNPFYWITTLAQWIGWLVNTFILGFILIERAVTLAILNILSPFIIALSVLEPFRSMLMKWIKLYSATFLITPVILIIGTLCTLIYMGLANVCGGIGLVTDDMAIVVCIVVMAKARLFRAGINLLNKLFGV